MQHPGCALALLITDEPTTALDVTVQAQIVRLLRQLKESGLALLLISHDLSIIRELADDTAVMKDGRFVEVQTSARLFAASQHPYTHPRAPGRGVAEPGTGPAEHRPRGARRARRAARSRRESRGT